MPRPKKTRIVARKVDFDYFKPRGVALNDLEEVQLTVDELEALRLKDYFGMDQKLAASKMDISQPTFHRLITDARKKIAVGLIEGMAIKIKGGKYTMPKKDGSGPNGEGPRTGRGKGDCIGDEESNDQNRPKRKGGGPYGRGKKFQK